MDNGLKRPLKGASVLSELGLDFDNVTWILEDDFEHIPLGMQIDSKSECMTCWTSNETTNLGVYLYNYDIIIWW